MQLVVLSIEVGVRLCANFQWAHMVGQRNLCISEVIDSWVVKEAWKYGETLEVLYNDLIEKEKVKLPEWKAPKVIVSHLAHVEKAIELIQLKGWSSGWIWCKGRGK